MKIAICLHGKIGNILTKSGDSNVGSDVVLKIAHQHWDRYFLNPYKPDVFIHSWDTNLENKIVELFQPKSYVIEKQKIFDVPDWVPGDPQRRQNHFSKWYSNKKAVELMTQYEGKHKIAYDLVIIARFDIAWRKQIKLEKLDSKKFYIGGWIRNPRNKVKDFWFISSPKNIRKFSEIYDNIEKYCSPEMRVVSKSNGISNHKMAAYHISVCQFEIQELLKCNDDLDGEKSDYPLIRYYYFGAQK